VYSIVVNSRLQAWEYPCGPIVANYLWACNGKVSVSLFCGLFCTCGMQSLGIIIGHLENNYRLILGE